MPTSLISSLDFGGQGRDLLFLHANGYPPECYRPLLSRLAESNHVTAMLQRPLWPDSRPEDIQDWMPFTDDLIRFLDQIETRTPIAVIGHSLGGIAVLRAALRQPGRFRTIILIDPVLLPPCFIAIWNLALKFNFAHRLHPHIASTLNRRREFDDLERVFHSYRLRPVLRYLDDEALRAYIEGITCRGENGTYRLRYSPEWEARIYYGSIWRDMDLWRNLRRLQVPTLILRGAETDTFWKGTARKVRRLNPAIRVDTLQRATHLVALERPQEVSALILGFLEAHT